ncbi:MAG: hypothetical protein BWY77_01946 [bacterium ADurb.Bin431]|nr:MAG: hypothetical protein BWY77_01946 [bacterium ADurb.Bin431]
MGLQGDGGGGKFTDDPLQAELRPHAVALLQIGHAKHVEGLVAKTHPGIFFHQLLEQADAFFHVGAGNFGLVENLVFLKGLKLLLVLLHLLLKEGRRVTLVELG